MSKLAWRAAFLMTNELLPTRASPKLHFLRLPHLFIHLSNCHFALNRLLKAALWKEWKNLHLILKPLWSMSLWFLNSTRKLKHISSFQSLEWMTKEIKIVWWRQEAYKDSDTFGSRDFSTWFQLSVKYTVVIIPKEDHLKASAFHPHWFFRYFII